MPGYDASAWQMIVAPAKTPKAIVGKLNAELHAIVSEPDLQRISTAAASSRSRPRRRTSCSAIVKSEIERWGKVVEQAGATGSQ